MIPSKSSQPAEIAGSLEALIGREHVSEDYVHFRIELLKAQVAVRDELARSASPLPSRTAVKEKGDTPALDPGEVPFDHLLLGRLLDGFAGALQRRFHHSRQLIRLSAAAARNPWLLQQIACKAAFGPDESSLTLLSKDLQIDVEALLFFGRVLSAPFVTEAVRRLKQRGVKPEATGCCPFCGSPPGMAKLSREFPRPGGRVLFCSLCSESWEFARLTCPFCGDQRVLDVLSMGEDDPCSIETCSGCKSYLKTVDERKLPDDQTVLPLVQATATLHLDLIAQQEGYATALPYSALR